MAPLETDLNWKWIVKQEAMCHTDRRSGRDTQRTVSVFVCMKNQMLDWAICFPAFQSAAARGVCARGCVWVCSRLRYEWSFGQHQRALTLTSLESSQESFSGFPNNGPSPQSDPVVPGRFHSELFGRFLSDSLSELVCHRVAFRNQMMWLYTVTLKQRLDL